MESLHHTFSGQRHHLLLLIHF